MNGYAWYTAEEHEESAADLAKVADGIRNGTLTFSPKYDCKMQAIRVCQNLAAMHHEDAQRIRNQS